MEIEEKENDEDEDEDEGYIYTDLIKYINKCNSENFSYVLK
jgi:hypothetical protein